MSHLIYEKFTPLYDHIKQKINRRKIEILNIKITLCDLQWHFRSYIIEKLAHS